MAQKIFSGIRTTLNYKKVNNVFPQVDCFIDDNNIGIWDKTRIVSVNSNEFYSPLYFRLNAKTLRTDVLSQTHIYSSGLLVSRKVRDILSNHNMTDTQFIPCTVIDGENNHDYFYLYSTADLIMDIDYQNTIFQTENVLSGKVVLEYTLGNYKQLLQRTMRLSAGMRIVTKMPLRLINNSCIDKDILICSCIMSRNVFVSKKIKEELLKNKITGVDMSTQILSIEI